LQLLLPGEQKEKDRAMKKSVSKQTFLATEELYPSLPCIPRLPWFQKLTLPSQVPAITNSNPLPQPEFPSQLLPFTIFTPKIVSRAQANPKVATPADPWSSPGENLSVSEK
jgi:hypothetical protein